MDQSTQRYIQGVQRKFLSLIKCKQG